MVPAIGLIGHHNSGKTTLGSGVVALLMHDGYKVGVIKSTKEQGIAFDHPGTDTHTYYDTAGAEGVVLAAPDQLVYISRETKPNPYTLCSTFFNRMDFVLIEGFKHTPFLPKIEVHRDESPYLFEQVEGVIGLVTNGPPVAGLACFTPDQHRELADFIRDRCINGPPQKDHDLRLLVDGCEVTLPDKIMECIRETLGLR